MPAGVFNLVNGDGAGVGQAIAAHPDIDMVSFTGSTRAGVAVAKAAADTVKRVTQELGGKSANILLPDVDFERAVTLGVARCFNNRASLRVARARWLTTAEEVEAIARKARRASRRSRRRKQGGPVAKPGAFEKVQRRRRRMRGRCRKEAGGPQQASRGFFVPAHRIRGTCDGDEHRARGNFGGLSSWL